VVASLLLTSEGKLVPDVHPVTVLAIDTLATNLNLNHGDELLTGVVKPTGKNTTSGTSIILVNFRKSKLKVSSVSKITISGDCALNSAAEICLAVKGLFN